MPNVRRSSLDQLAAQLVYGPPHNMECCQTPAENDICTGNKRFRAREDSSKRLVTLREGSVTFRFQRRKAATPSCSATLIDIGCLYRLKDLSHLSHDMSSAVPITVTMGCHTADRCMSRTCSAAVLLVSESDHRTHASLILTRSHDGECVFRKVIMVEL